MRTSGQKSHLCFDIALAARHYVRSVSLSQRPGGGGAPYSGGWDVVVLAHEHRTCSFPQVAIHLQPARIQAAFDCDFDFAWFRLSDLCRLDRRVRIVGPFTAASDAIPPAGCRSDLVHSSLPGEEYD